MNDEKNMLHHVPIQRYIDSNDYVELIAPHDFNFAEALAYLGRSDQDILIHIKDNQLYKVLKVNDNYILMKISCTHQNIRIDFLNYKPNKTERLLCADEIWDTFDLGRRLDPFYLLGERDPILNPLIQKYRGLRIVGITDLFEAITWAVIGQQINLPFAYTLKRRMIERFGEHITYKGETYWLYPTADRMSEASVQDLIDLKFTTKKAEYVIDTAKMMKRGDLSKDRLLDDDNETKLNQLTSIRGIGQWTAHYVMLRCLKVPSAFPITDVGLHNALKAQLNWDRKPTINEIEKLAEHWDGWQAYATFYLWRTLLD